VSAAKPIQHVRSLKCTVPDKDPGLERVALKIAKGMEGLPPTILVNLYHCKQLEQYSVMHSTLSNEDMPGK
jgi:hypothetical protein